MPEPTLPLPTEPVPYFDPTAMNPVIDPDDAAAAAAPTAPMAGQAPAVAAVGQAPAVPAVGQAPVAPAPGHAALASPPAPGLAAPMPPAPGLAAPAPQPPAPAPGYAAPANPPAPQAPPLAPSPAQQPGYAASAYPQAGMPAPAQPAPIVAQIGDVRVSSTTIYTPTGEIPLRGSQWMVTDQWQATQKTPTWAIVLAIVGFFCLTFFSLLFLLAKEVVYNGVVQVVITNGPRQHVVRVPVTSQAQVANAHAQVNYVRSLAGL